MVPSVSGEDSFIPSFQPKWSRSVKARDEPSRDNSKTNVTLNSVRKFAEGVVGPARLELATSPLSGVCSNQLSYEPANLVFGETPQTQRKRIPQGFSKNVYSPRVLLIGSLVPTMFHRATGAEWRDISLAKAS